MHEVADESRGPVTSVSAREEAEIVEECIAELPEEYREIIVLRDYVGYGWEDVASHPQSAERTQNQEADQAELHPAPQLPGVVPEPVPVHGVIERAHGVSSCRP